MQVVAEELVCEFHAEPSTVMRVVCECVDEFPEDGAWFIEQASRARLRQLKAEPPRPAS
jgi:hypothetical protein